MKNIVLSKWIENTSKIKVEINNYIEVEFTHEIPTKSQKSALHNVTKTNPTIKSFRHFPKQNTAIILGVAA